MDDDIRVKSQDWSVWKIWWRLVKLLWWDTFFVFAWNAKVNRKFGISTVNWINIKWRNIKTNEFNWKFIWNPYSWVNEIQIRTSIQAHSSISVSSNTILSIHWYIVNILLWVDFFKIFILSFRRHKWWQQLLKMQSQCAKKRKRNETKHTKRSCSTIVSMRINKFLKQNRKR